MNVNRQLIEYASWRVVSEVFRRHPNDFRLIETHPCDGQYDCLSLVDADNQIAAHFNRHGTLHIDRTHTGFDIWRTVVEEGDTKAVLDRISEGLRLPVPRVLPPSTPTAIVYRFMAAVLAPAVFGRDTWECRNGYCDSSGFEGCFVRDYFDVFPVARERLTVEKKSDLLRQPAYRFWFLLKNEKPCLCAETTGHVWLPGGESYDLAKMYADVHRIAPLVGAIASRFMK